MNNINVLISDKETINVTFIGGEVNTVKNVGTGISLFLNKIGSILNFKGLIAGSSKLLLTNNTGDKNIEIDIVEANLDLNNIGGIVAITKGGTGQTTQQAAIDSLTNVSVATDEYVLTKDAITGEAIFKEIPAGGAGVVFKQYLGDGTDFSITSDAGGFSLNRAVAIPYQTTDGTWRLIFNISYSTGAVGGHTTTISGVTFRTLEFNGQACIYFGSSDGRFRARCETASGDIFIGSNVVTFASTISGDVELDAKPSWAD